jgi:acyl-CoA thioester hydrolase
MNDQHAVFEMSMPIRWGDMDAFGHVNNTVYFRYMEQVRISWFEHLDIYTGGNGGSANGQGPVIVNASMEFLKQLHYPGDVIARMSVGTLGRSSFDTGFELFRADDPETLYARGAARCVWIDYAAGKSVPIPDVLRSTIENAVLVKAA